MAAKVNPDLEAQAKILTEIVKTKFKSQERITISGEPKLIKNAVVEYDKKLKVSALDKFNNPGYVCGCSYYKSDADKSLHKAVGAVAIYTYEKEIGLFLKAFGLTDFDDEDEQQIAKKNLEFGMEILEGFKSAMLDNGYTALVMSDPVSFRNGIPQGLDFSFDQFEKYEIHFPVSNQPRIIAELTMTQIPKR